MVAESYQPPYLAIDPQGTTLHEDALKVCELEGGGWAVEVAVLHASGMATPRFWDGAVELAGELAAANPGQRRRHWARISAHCRSLDPQGLARQGAIPAILVSFDMDTHGRQSGAGIRRGTIARPVFVTPSRAALLLDHPDVGSLDPGEAGTAQALRTLCRAAYASAQGRAGARRREWWRALSVVDNAVEECMHAANTAMAAALHGAGRCALYSNQREATSNQLGATSWLSSRALGRTDMGLAAYVRATTPARSLESLVNQACLSALLRGVDEPFHEDWLAVVAQLLNQASDARVPPDAVAWQPSGARRGRVHGHAGGPYLLDVARTDHEACARQATLSTQGRRDVARKQALIDLEAMPHAPGHLDPGMDQDSRHEVVYACLRADWCPPWVLDMVGKHGTGIVRTMRAVLCHQGAGCTDLKLALLDYLEEGLQGEQALCEQAAASARAILHSLLDRGAQAKRRPRYRVLKLAPAGGDGRGAGMDQDMVCVEARLEAGIEAELEASVVCGLGTTRSLAQSRAVLALICNLCAIRWAPCRAPGVSLGGNTDLGKPNLL